ncbi:MAG: DNA gyrase subunit A, partial [Actinobacteria bacterium]|nr:DNA gyrase subunit A [Actinomycetota bacterium]
QSSYLVLATRAGQVKKTKLDEYDTNRSGGIIAIGLRDDDEVISAALVEASDELILVSRKGMSVRFAADDATVRPMGRAAGGVIGMKFRGDDNLLAMQVVRPGASLVTVTSGGFGKRTPLEEWNTKGRATLGVRAMRLVEARGDLVAAVVVDTEDEIFAIASNGVVIRTRVAEVRETGRDTMGVMLMGVGDAEVVAVARGEAGADDDDAAGADVGDLADDGVEIDAADGVGDVVSETDGDGVNDTSTGE